MSTKSDAQAQTSTNSKGTSTYRPQNEELYIRSAELGSLFSKPAAVLGERETDYDELLAKVTVAMMPRDVIEDIWVRDFVDLVWEGQRLRRLKHNLLRRGAQEAVEEVLEGIEGAEVINGVAYDVSSIAACYTKRYKQVVTHVHGILADQHLDDNEMTARAFAFHIEMVERIERMIAGLEARRSRVISEFERYRDGDRRRSRRITDNVTDID